MWKLHPCKCSPTIGNGWFGWITWIMIIYIMLMIQDSSVFYHCDCGYFRHYDHCRTMEFYVCVLLSVLFCWLSLLCWYRIDYSQLVGYVFSMDVGYCHLSVFSGNFLHVYVIGILKKFLRKKECDLFFGLGQLDDCFF